ncbi:MAG: SRPBCC family protein [Hormoscilla sp.]
MTISLNYPIVAVWTKAERQALMQGEILVQAKPHQLCGGVAIARMHLPLRRHHLWQQLTDYPRWVEYFPNLTKSQLLPQRDRQGRKRIHQIGCKNFILFSALVEIYLQVTEIPSRQIQFRLESGTFENFSADLDLEDYGNGTLITYSVEATPSFPIPAVFIQQALQLEMPKNMRQMRQVLCQNNC